MVQDGIRRMKMAEYQHFDGETYITFNIVFATDNEIQIAVTNRGKISVLTYDLYLSLIHI